MSDLRAQLGRGSLMLWRLLLASAAFVGVALLVTWARQSGF